VIDSRKKRPKESSNQPEENNSASTSLFEEKAAAKSKAALRAQARLTHTQLRELEAKKEKEVAKGYRRVQELWAGMLARDEEAEREWLVEAEKLVETFRETRNLFLTSRVRTRLSWLQLSLNPLIIGKSVPGHVSKSSRAKATRSRSGRRSNGIAPAS
jgi:hypothetical protein